MPDDTPDAVPDNHIFLDFADGEYEFRLPIAQVAELQEKCGNVGIGAIFSRLMAGRYRNPTTGEVVLNPVEAMFKYEDVCEVIRLGLIGGNRGVVDGKEIEVNPVKARDLVKNYVHTRPLMESWRIASAILSAFIIGYADKTKAQKKSRRANPAGAKKKAGSTSQPA